MNTKNQKNAKLESEIKKLSSRGCSELNDIFTHAHFDHLVELKEYLDDAYYNTEYPKLEDYQYDVLKEVIEKRNPHNYETTVGAEVSDENKSELPFFLGSMDKIKNTEPKKLATWTKNKPSDEYVVEDKLDGVSCLLVSKKGDIKLYKRGNGLVGPDVSHFARHFCSIPGNLPDMAVRGELVMGTKIFLEKHSESANPRNFVNGRTSGKEAREGIKDVDFVAYEIMSKGKSPKPSLQLEKLRNLGFLTVNYEIVRSLDVEDLFDRLKEHERCSDYEIDGLILTSDLEYEHTEDKYPKYSRAFKVNFEEHIKETTVLRVEWEVSRYKILTPVVHVEPKLILGAVISHPTGHNAKFIADNKIGPGTVLRITRSGSVIPYIVDVIKHTEAQMPDISYKWGMNEIDIYTEEEAQKVTMKMITVFFFQLEIKHVGEATVTKLCEHGFDSLFKILEADKEDFGNIPRFGEKTVERLYSNIHNGLKNVSLATVIGSSGVMDSGIGNKRMEVLLREIPDLLSVYKEISREELVSRIVVVEGFSNKIANQIAENIRSADEFVRKISKYATFKEIKKKEIIQNDVGLLPDEKSVVDKIFVFSGFRNNALEDKIKINGGIVTTGVSKKTTALIVKNKDESTTKINKAKSSDVPVYTLDEFFENYILHDLY
jgi:NAD-dependent DNA ligase